VKTVRGLDEEGKWGLSSDGVDASSAAIPGLFPEGFLVAHDGGGKRYHAYDWRDVAEADLKLCGAGGGEDPLPPPKPRNLRVK
jgi:hypothetical protein